MTGPRLPTAIDAFAERYVAEYCALDPTAATSWGVSGHDDRMPDLSPDGLAERSQLRRRTLAELTRLTSVDASDQVTAAALRGDLELAEALRDTGAEESHLDNISSPVQSVRDTFDLMPVQTEQDWSVVATRLAGVPAALAGYADSLRLAAARGDVSPVRQVTAGIVQSRQFGGPDGFFATFVSGANAVPDGLRAELERAAAGAAAAYDRLAHMLSDELLPLAPSADAVGPERYALMSQHHVGVALDLEETYEWGQQELARITGEMQATAQRIRPGSTPQEAMRHLDSDPARVLSGTPALREWMQRTSDEAIDALAGSHFDVPDPVRTLECRIAPTTSGGIYYTPPSDDFSRPGRMWWAVPDGVTEFSTWRERTTVYHEGVPGHHLQCGQTVFRRDLLNLWRRVASWNSGHGEGWALYAERLMADLGFLDDPGDYLGMLDGQSMRAARVVLDIGVHCRFPAPAEVGGGEWDYDKAWAFLNAHAAMAEGFLRYELDRYLGWPGQAPAYKVGERLWLALREEVRAKQGDAFDQAAFHRRALDIGSVGMGVLRDSVLATS